MSVPQSAPELGETAPFKRNVSGHDEKVMNLMARFPGVPEDEIRKQLQKVDGHASKARNNIQKKYRLASGTPTSVSTIQESPSSSPNATPQPVLKEPPLTSPEVSPAPVAREPAVPEDREPAVAEAMPTVPQSAPALRQPPPPEEPLASTRSSVDTDSKLENLKSRFPDKGGDAVQGALKQADGHAGKAATILSKGQQNGGGNGSASRLGEAADYGKIDSFLASLSKTELQNLQAKAANNLGVAPPAAAPVASRQVAVPKKAQGAGCFRMLGHICAVDGAKGVKAQARADSKW